MCASLSVGSSVCRKNINLFQAHTQVTTFEGETGAPQMFYNNGKKLQTKEEKIPQLPMPQN